MAVEVETPVSVFVMRILPSASIAPWLSETMPDLVAVLICACDTVAVHKTTHIAKNTFTSGEIKLVLRMLPPSWD